MPQLTIVGIGSLLLKRNHCTFLGSHASCVLRLHSPTLYFFERVPCSSVPNKHHPYFAAHLD